MPEGVLRYDVQSHYTSCNPSRPVTCLRSITIKFYNVPISPTDKRDYVITKDRTQSYFKVPCVSFRFQTGRKDQLTYFVSLKKLNRNRLLVCSVACCC